jgi:hypothetical protein
MGVRVIAKRETCTAPERSVLRILLATSVRVMPGGSAPWDGKSSIVMATACGKAAGEKINMHAQTNQKKTQDAFIEILSGTRKFKDIHAARRDYKRPIANLRVETSD